MEKSVTTSKCNSAAWLRCENGICECSKPNEMVFHKSENTCVVRAGERCRIAIGDEQYGFQMHYDLMRCVPSANCDPVGTCKCERAYFETIEGNCDVMKTYGSKCNATNECDDGQFLACIDGTCTCDAEVSAMVRGYNSWDHAGCVGLPGKQCLNNRCIKNSDCDSYTNKCLCNNGFMQSGNKCRLGFNHQCSQDNSERCGEHFNCVDSRCNCKYASSQFYGPSWESCISRVGGTCEPGHEEQCVRNSECVSDKFYSQCKCKSGFVPTPNGYCDIGHGSPCPVNPSSTQASNDYEPVCDKLVPLSCVNGVCDCRDEGTIYDTKRRKCVWLVGFNCEADEECVEHTICDKAEQRPELPGTCACAPGYSEDAERTCAVVDALRE